MQQKNLTTQIMIKFKNSNFDEIQKPKLWWDSKTQIVTKFKKNKIGWNSRTQIVMILKNSNCNETQTQIVMKFKNSNGDKTQKLKL